MSQRLDSRFFIKNNTTHPRAPNECCNTKALRNIPCMNLAHALGCAVPKTAMGISGPVLQNLSLATTHGDATFPGIKMGTELSAAVLLLVQFANWGNDRVIRRCRTFSESPGTCHWGAEANRCLLQLTKTKTGIAITTRSTEPHAQTRAQYGRTHRCPALVRLCVNI